LVWFALARLGAIEAPVNTAFRGPALAHLLELIETEVVIVDESMCASVAAVADALTHVRVVVVRGDPSWAIERFPQWNVVALSAGLLGGAPRGLAAPTHSETDPAMLLFTSGTTGRSKGCVLSHRYAVRQAELTVEHLGLRTDDVLYCPFPLFHLDATVLTVMPALVLGTTAAIGERFSASRFWHEIRSFGATVFDFMGATLAILYKQAPDLRDGDNPARLGWGVPLPPELAATFETRFGVRLVELYGSTDVGVPIYTPLDEPRRPGSCGRPIPAYDVELVDESDRPVDVGTVGEIVVRPNEPSLIMDGYYRMPEATLQATRNLWFHTGDLARADSDGFLYFVGRRTDSIRRRGENISAFEIEEAINLHPDVLEVAAYGVPSELSEDDVMVAIVARPGCSLDPVDLVAFCENTMARHMVPRYIDIVDALPKTPTEKVEKYRLAARGPTATTWDRQPAHM
jgi:crotonobetaine/carnitine-CoA ligase